MYVQVEKPKENKSRTVANSVVQKKSNERFGFVDNRHETILQLMDSSDQQVEGENHKKKRKTMDFSMFSKKEETTEEIEVKQKEQGEKLAGLTLKLEKLTVSERAFGDNGAVFQALHQTNPTIDVQMKEHVEYVEAPEFIGTPHTANKSTFAGGTIPDNHGIGADLLSDIATLIDPGEYDWRVHQQYEINLVGSDFTKTFGYVMDRKIKVESASEGNTVTLIYNKKGQENVAVTGGVIAAQVYEGGGNNFQNTYSYTPNMRKKNQRDQVI
jgi:hypothetical protein